MIDKKSDTSGDILLQTLFFLLVVSVLVGGASGLMLSQLKWSNHSINHIRAQSAARSAVERAIGHLKKDRSFREDIKISWEGATEEAMLTFDASAGVPYSTNNTGNNLTVEGWDGPEPLSEGRVIPNSVHLVAVGSCRNARYVSEAVLVFPSSPYALASSGKIQSTGRLEVFGVESLDAVDSTHPDDRLESHIVSNSKKADSIVLSAGAEVSGDLRSTGGIQADGAKVDGEILANQGEQAVLPKLELDRPTSGGDEDTIYLSDYDFTKNPALGADSDANLLMSPADALADPDVFDVSELRVKVDAGAGPLELNKGVELNNGTLFVDGDLVIRGGVSGTGAIFATGKVTIHGPSNLASDQLAVMSGGGVELNGRGLGLSKFRGLVATSGPFKADNIELQGAMLSVGPENSTSQIGPAGGEPGMTLDNVTTVHAPDANKMDIVVHLELKETLVVGEGSWSSGGSQIGLLHDGTFYTFTGDSSLSEAEQEAQRQATYQALLGVQGETHPMADGEVVLRTAGGGFQGVDELSGSARTTLFNFQSNWNNYTNKLKKSEVKEVDIFHIDLNRFTSGSSRVRILTYR